MTIKQNGGIFGRNPTFNNVTVDGTLAVGQIVEKTGAAGITLDGVTLKDGNVVLSSGNGIDFSATSGTGTSELFDDYEEGTWTVELYDAASGGNVSPTTVTGTYTKIGNTVLATFFNLADIDTTGMTGASSLWITVPFTPSSAASGSVAVDSITFPAGKTSLSLSLGSSSARMRILLSGSAAVDSAIPVGNLTSGASDIVHATIAYIAA